MGDRELSQLELGLEGVETYCAFLSVVLTDTHSRRSARRNGSRIQALASRPPSSGFAKKCLLGSSGRTSPQHLDPHELALVPTIVPGWPSCPAAALTVSAPMARGLSHRRSCAKFVLKSDAARRTPREHWCERSGCAARSASPDNWLARAEFGFNGAPKNKNRPRPSAQERYSVHETYVKVKVDVQHGSVVNLTSSSRARH